MKQLLIFLVFLLVTITTSAQTLIGIRAGITTGKVNGIGGSSDNYEYNWKQGYHYGFFLNKNIGENLFLQPEIIYNKRGFHYVKQYSKSVIVSRDTIQHKQKTELNYLDLPLLFKLQLKRFYIEMGPQFGVFLNGKNEHTYIHKRNGALVESYATSDPKAKVVPLDIGYIAGLGYQTKYGLGLGVRYNQGFKEVIKRVNWQKNISLQASVSYIMGYRAYYHQVYNTHKLKSEGYEYYDPKKNKIKSKVGYKIIRQYQVQKVSIMKVGEASRSEVQLVFNSAGNRNPETILLSGSSGMEEQNSSFTGFRDIQMPFKANITYSVQSSLGTGKIESSLELQISEPGIWRVNILTQ